MKKFLLTLAALGAMSAANAQQTYNFFDPADCDADGWIWFDTQAKLDKYCGFSTKKISYKVQFLAAGYEDKDYNYPEPIANPDYIGYGTDGKIGGPGSKTGAIVLPTAGPDFAGYLAPANHGGGILLHLPDCAVLELYISASQENLYLCCEGNEGNEKPDYVGMIKGGEFYPAYLVGQSLPGVKYTGAWKDIQNLEDDEFYVIGNATNTRHFKLQSAAAGEKRTALFYNYMKDSPLYIHGMRVLTYTDVSKDSAVEEIEIPETTEEDVIYTLQGIRVKKITTPGFYIINGKKVHCR